MPRPDIRPLVEKLQTLKEAKDKPLHSENYFAMPGFEQQKKRSEQDYGESLNELRVLAPQCAAALFITGPGAKAMADIFADEEWGLVLDAEALYRRIAERWYPTTDGVGIRKFSIDNLITFIGGVNQALYPLGVSRIAPPDFNPFFGRPIENVNDATVLTRDVLRITVGDDLNAIQLNADLADRIVADGWDAAVVPVAIVNATKEEVDGELRGLLFNGRSLVVEAPENVDKNATLIAVKHLKELFPKK